MKAGGDLDERTGRAIQTPLPIVSVVVASYRERRLLEACLRSLEKQCREHRAEIVVARDCDAKEIDELGKRYPFARFIARPGDTIPRLRAMGMVASRGKLVALTEDHCIPGADWIGKIIEALQHGTEVVGGAMDNAQRERAVDWAAYFAEYGFFAENGGSQSAGPLLTAANVAYSRDLVDEVTNLANQGEWENVIHDHLLAQGHSLKFVRNAIVYQNKNYRFWDFCCDRFAHGRDYARRRLVDGACRRWFHFAGAFLLPAILTARVARNIGRSHREPFCRSLPLTFAFLTAWSAGEAVGYWRGPRYPDQARG